MTKTNFINLKAIILTIFICAAGAWGQAGVICSPPAECSPVFNFKPWDLTFSTGRKQTFSPGETAESNEFYAVVLDSTKIGFSEGDRCDDFKAKRAATQRSFPKNKVFVSDYCNLKNVIVYSGFGDWHERNLMAVFVGEVGDPEESAQFISEATAKAFLKKAQINYPKAQLKKMTAMIDYTRR